ncbi:MAG: hypothetical protein WBP11_13455 [Dokdonella sp.]
MFTDRGILLGLAICGIPVDSRRLSLVFPHHLGISLGWHHRRGGIAQCWLWTHFISGGLVGFAGLVYTIDRVRLRDAC